ncbi:GNAT family N-acetyltransferase [Auraticoccus monumenti]|uniref:Lysine N-acyltransferase MbtK n=1 Tax=Auraticoccus monumenti TaxID=675864 RepID=A0A1G6X8M2_9ACTN|nr:GNAT family N-acetyltransferase [Auraticoccus monumenti]SDD74498.1 Siderophore synthetase component [Auraticoccus monumenti]
MSLDLTAPSQDARPAEPVPGTSPSASPVGEVTLEPLQLPRDLDLLHVWVTHPRSRYWGMQGADRAAVERAYAAIVADPTHDAWLGRVEGEPAFLAETYQPAHSELAAHYPVRPGDLGMHVLVAPPEQARTGFTSAVFAAVVQHCFADPATVRVVVEPDVGNRPVAAKNAAAGFVVDRLVRLSDKTAALSFCTREDFRTSALGPEPAAPAAESADHLSPERGAEAHRHLVAKALSEFSHERLLTPRRSGEGWLVETSAGSVRYTFRATRQPMEHWVVDPASIRRTRDGAPCELDVLELVLELHEVLGIPDHLLGTYLEELSSTLAGLAYKRASHRLSAADLLHAPFQRIEAAMTEGHPAYLANNGRIGFGRAAHDTWSPEAGRPQHLTWLAVRRSHSRFSGGRGVEEERLLVEELGAEQLAVFRERLTSLGLDPGEYRMLPVHPWQWDARIAVTFAADVARRDLVHLGPSQDRYLAQQSIRTFFNADRPDRHYVKTALAIQNMGFLRGLSARYMEATPAINDFVADLVAADPTLQECRFSVLRELAAVGWTGGVHARLPAGSPYQKMIASLWRESPVPGLAADERLATMASLLHRDAAGRSHLVELVRASGLGAEEWVRRYLHAYLRPVVHCLVAHDLAFMPHGENLIMVLVDHVPVRMIMKDIGEEVAVLREREVPAGTERVVTPVPEDVRALSVQTDVFDGVLRYAAALLDGAGELRVDRFWALVAECLDRHEADHPELAGRLDLRAPRFAHSCLNRLQLRNTLQMVDLSDQTASLIMTGTLANPVARA